MMEMVAEVEAEKLCLTSIRQTPKKQLILKATWEFVFYWTHKEANVSRE